MPGTRWNVDETPIRLQISQAKYGRIEKLAIREDGSLDPVITIPALSVAGVDVNLATHEVTVRDIAVERASFTAWLNPDGTLLTISKCLLLWTLSSLRRAGEQRFSETQGREAVDRMDQRNHDGRTMRSILRIAPCRFRPKSRCGH